MLKRKFLLIISFVLSLGCFAGDYDLKNVPEDFIGTYIPVQMEVFVKEYMSYEKALFAIAKSHYDILLLNKNICYSQVMFGDGYAVETRDFEKWSFVKRGNERFILDENGLSYRRISTKSDDYDAYAERILSLIFVDASHDKNIWISGKEVSIYGHKYYFQLSPSYMDEARENNALYLSGCLLRIEGVGAKIYSVVSDGNSRWGDLSLGKVVQTVSLFYWNNENYPDLNVYKYKDSKSDLRLLRNIIYAKHGYVFKSEDLSRIFDAFYWYEPNFNFSEDDFSNWEKNILKEIQRYESEIK